MKFLPCSLLAAALLPGLTAPAADLQLQSGDRIAILGNGLADRSQHYGWFESMILQSHPELDLVFRNLSFAGDELDTWHRVDDFGSREEWLEKVGANVVFAYYGYNESFDGYEGIDAFKGKLVDYLAEVKAGPEGATRQVVLFSPIAVEQLDRPGLPALDETRTNLQNYTAAMAEVAEAEGVPFVNLLEPSLELQEEGPLTINGFLLSEDGDRRVAAEAFEGLFGSEAPEVNEELRQAVVEKNWQWHQRYRTVDGYNIYGGRSAMAYKPGEGGFIRDAREAPEPYFSNFKIMQQEMAQRDVMTENREKRAWALAKGQDLEVTDDNLPAVEDVPTNMPSPDSGQEFNKTPMSGMTFDPETGLVAFPDGEEAISMMTTAPGLKINLFADEKQFPELVNPVQMAWDTRGRLWVSAWKNYPSRTPTSTDGDKLLVLEDTDGDGRADTCEAFVDDLNCPTAFQFYKDGVIVMQSPDLVWIRDTDGDGKGDTRERLLMGLCAADSHHETCYLSYDNGGAIYPSDGVFHRSQVETLYGPVRNTNGAIFRYDLNTQKFDRYTTNGTVNPHGKVFDRWGNALFTDATGNRNFFAEASSAYLPPEGRDSAKMKEFWIRPARPSPGNGMLSSTHFPEEFHGRYLNANVISFQGIWQVDLSQDGSGLKGETVEHDIVSADPAEHPTFRPSCMQVGPDGALYFCDWANAIIGHLQHHLRDPNRDHKHGRIYRVTYEGRPLLKPKPIHGQPISALLDLLKEPENGVRELAKIELANHQPEQIAVETQQWISNLDKAHADYEHHMLEALWVHQWNHLIDLELLENRLNSPDPRARAAATRVLCYWARDGVVPADQALAWTRERVLDEDPRVRLQAVRTCSFLQTGAAAEVALLALQSEMDDYLDHILSETMVALEPFWREAINSGEPFAADNAEGLKFLLGSLNGAELQKLPHTEEVLTALVARRDVPEVVRLASLSELGTMHDQSTTLEAIAALNRLDPEETKVADQLSRALVRQPAADLTAAKKELAALGRRTKHSSARRAALAAEITAEGSIDRHWKQAESDPAGLLRLVDAIPTIAEMPLRAQAHDRLRPLVEGRFAKDLTDRMENEGPKARFVRVELSSKGTLTLAEVEILSGGENMALGGKASQSSVASNGKPERAIDGNTSGVYNDGSSTHTATNYAKNPWWEVDLGKEMPIDEVVIWNRTDGDLGKRLEGYNLVLRNATGDTVYQVRKQPAPAPSATHALSNDLRTPIRQAAIRALVTTGSEPEDSFQLLAGLIADGQQRGTAVEAVRALPKTVWTADAAGPAAEGLVRWARGVAAASRTSTTYLDASQLARDFAALMPEAEAAPLLAELKDLSVDVFLVRMVHEQMRYDVSELTVTAGKPFEVILENDDNLPHNFVVVSPGKHVEIGNAAMTMLPTALDSKGRAYLPPAYEKDILAATKMLEPHESDRLKMKAPKTPGAYEFVCTFPGHALVMWGTLNVVAPE